RRCQDEEAHGPTTREHAPSAASITAPRVGSRAAPAGHPRRGSRVSLAERPAALSGTHLLTVTGPRPLGDGVPRLRPPKSVVTEPSSKTSRMARANSGAIDSTVILSSLFSGGSGSVFVTTTSLIRLFFSRSVAGSESRA